MSNLIPMKKWILAFVFLVLVLGLFLGWKLLGPVTQAPEGKYFYIATGATYNEVKKELTAKKVLRGTFWFDWLAKKMDYPSLVKPGRYLIPPRTSLLQLVRMLRNGRQSPVNLVISRRIRVREDLVKLMKDKFEFSADDMNSFLASNDSLKKYGLDTAGFTLAIFPDTYQFFWNTTPRKVYDRLWEESTKYWTPEKVAKARAKGLTILEAHVLASVVEEETNYGPEKPTIASVYLNRVAKGIPLQADPTVKFALRDFGLRRIYFKHLQVASPYNTYRNKGLPPGPICNVQKSTLDAVLDAPKTDYIYFVANSDFSGSHVFSADDVTHMKLARQYQLALDSLQKAKQK